MGFAGEFLPEFAFTRFGFVGDLDFDADEEVGVFHGRVGEAFAANAEFVAGLGPRWDFDADLAVESGDGEGSAENGFPGSKLEIACELTSFDPELRVGGVANLEVEITGSGIGE